MDEEAVLTPHLKRYLSYSFEERLGFNVTYSAADLSDDHVSIGFLPTRYTKSFISFVIWGMT